VAVSCPSVLDHPLSHHLGHQLPPGHLQKEHFHLQSFYPQVSASWLSLVSSTYQTSIREHRHHPSHRGRMAQNPPVRHREIRPCHASKELGRGASSEASSCPSISGHPQGHHLGHHFLPSRPRMECRRHPTFYRQTSTFCLSLASSACQTSILISGHHQGRPNQMVQNRHPQEIRPGGALKDA